MGNDRERNSHGQYADRIPAKAAREVFEERDDFGRPLTADDIIESLDCSRRTAHNKLNTLVDEGILETRKIGASGRVWWVPIETGTEPASSRSDLEASPHPIQDAMDEIDLPGSGSTLEARRDALLAAYDYLITNPSARKSDFLENVYPDYPAEFETEEGWWNAIQPALKDLPGVDPLEERGNIWTFLGSDRFKPTLG
ncbi:helix-turn-helix domain-containing protein [Natrinema sp. SYSU A 869]|uniref:helix-turn-helix domain-containing protein n=1 Tax=Natrinema sp. SYSU A 869 TaxID=2871694 RepID=UPI001CA3F21A|nr:helix-turn-helix domain-containing protein [Natrinema sp. SYSU A 869]